MKDRDLIFHRRWLGLAQPIEGLVFSVPVLADAQIAPNIDPGITASFETYLEPGESRIKNLETFFREFLGYDQGGMLVFKGDLPADIAFYAAEGGQEIRPTFAIAQGPFTSDDPFASFDDAATVHLTKDSPSANTPWFALVWDLTEHAPELDLDSPETTTGPWKYPPTAKFERLLRHVAIPVGFLFNGSELRLLYAPPGETTAHLTFRVEHMRRPDGRPLLAALNLLLHSRRAYGANAEHTLVGLLAESRRRQADVTDELARQVFEAVEILVAGFEAAAARDCTDRIDWLRAALEEEDDHFYQGVLSIVLRLVFLLYSEDQGLLPVDHPTYAEHLSLAGLYDRLSQDAGAHPESMQHRFGAYGQLLSLFRVVFFGVKHGELELPPRRGQLFDPNVFPFLEGGLPGWTSSVVDPLARASAQPASVDDGTVYRVLHRLVVFEGQRLSYRTLDVEQIGSVYESLMGYHVLRLLSPAVRIGKYGVWVEADALRAMSPADRSQFLKETCGLSPGAAQSIEKALKESTEQQGVLDALISKSVGRTLDRGRHCADAGQLVLQPGDERRRTATHYTPRSLTEKVVKRTLEPLLACLGPERTPDKILQLKICDPAMGSGAFLVATCRELASEIVAAWTRRGELAKVIEQHGDAHLHARRLVAQKCLYGVDKNSAAVELAKLSLWLVTLSKSLPFTFVDHALRHGDSLVGLDFKQIEAFHWSPPGQVETCRALLRDALDQAVELRHQILELANSEDAESQTEKRRLLEFAHQAIDRVRTVADCCIGAFFAEPKEAGRERERRRRLQLVERWLGGDPEPESEVRLLASEARTNLTPFHWWLEFPEVFIEARPDPLQGGARHGAALMDAFIGNPPFLGGSRVSGTLGIAYPDWLAVQNKAAVGRGDLSAHFFWRTFCLLGAHGAAGLIATNSIAQGDTRETGLAPIVRAGGTVYDATCTLYWPGAANVAVSVVHFAVGAATQHVETNRRLDGHNVRAINSQLRAKPERDDPARLTQNSQLCYQGQKLNGAGFVLTPSEREEFVAGRPTSANVIFPFMGGEELNTDPSQGFNRYVINFGKMELAHVAKSWPELLERVRLLVKPARDAVKDNTGKGGHGKKYWWQFVDRCDPLHAALAPVSRCLVISCVTKHVCFAFQPKDRVHSHSMYVFALDGATAFAVLQSRIHERWARLLSSSLEDRLRYTASEIFDTFPFPRADARAVVPALDRVGQAVYDARSRYMVDTDQGLTKTYNALKDPACTEPRIVTLRDLHESMDRAVLEAYGWSDIPVPSYCPRTDAERQTFQAFEDEVIERLYALNAEREREEKRLGLAAGKKKRSRSNDENSSDTSATVLDVGVTKKPRSKRSAKDQGKLIE